MATLFWDASGLAKRYAPELGAATVRALLDLTPSPGMVLAYIVYAETAAILRRKRNSGQLTLKQLADGRAELSEDVFDSGRFTLLTVQDEDILEGIILSDTHNINSTDASILAAYINFARSLPPNELPCVLVAADQRLLRAALVEGLDVLNPETFAAADVAAFLKGAP